MIGLCTCPLMITHSMSACFLPAFSTYLQGETGSICWSSRRGMVIMLTKSRCLYFQPIHNYLMLSIGRYNRWRPWVTSYWYGLTNLKLFSRDYTSRSWNHTENNSQPVQGRPQDFFRGGGEISQHAKRAKISREARKKLWVFAPPPQKKIFRPPAGHFLGWGAKWV